MAYQPPSDPTQLNEALGGWSSTTTVDSAVHSVVSPCLALAEHVMDSLCGGGGEWSLGHGHGPGHASPSRGPAAAAERPELFPRLRSIHARVRAVFASHVSNHGRFAVRARVPYLLGAVVALHVAVAVLLMTYPYVVRSTLYDGWFVAFAVAVMWHWVLFKGECVLSYWEKVLLYESYTLGEAPLHHWFVDALPTPVLAAGGLVFFVGVCAAFGYVMLRNTLMSPWGIRLVRALLQLLLSALPTPPGDSV